MLYFISTPTQTQCSYHRTKQGIVGISGTTFWSLYKPLCETAKSFGWEWASEHILHWHRTSSTGLGFQTQLPLSPFIPSFRVWLVAVKVTNASYTPTRETSSALRPVDDVCEVSKTEDETLTYRHCWGNCCSPSLMASWTARCMWTLWRRENTINNSTLRPLIKQTLNTGRQRQ